VQQPTPKLILERQDILSRARTSYVVGKFNLFKPMHAQMCTRTEVRMYAYTKTHPQGRRHTRSQ